MVEVAADIAEVALEQGLLIVFVLGYRLLAIAQAVTFEVGFGNQINTVFVAEFVEIRIVRIVRGAHRVDAHPLHKGDVLEHTLMADHIAIVRVEFMAVDALE